MNFSSESACLVPVEHPEQAKEVTQKLTARLRRSQPITSFEGKKWLEVNFPSRGKVINFPSSHKNSFFSNPSFHGKTGHFKGKGKLFSRENYPCEGKFLGPS